MRTTEKKLKLYKLKLLQAHLKSEKYRALPIHKAFIEWYIEARFGAIATDDKFILDDSGEGGIDAIIYKDNKCIVLQSQYERVPRLASIARDKIAGFEAIARRVLGQESKESVDKWLQKVRSGSRSTVKELLAFAKKRRHDVRFLMITTHVLTIEDSQYIETDDAPTIIALWDLYQEGFTPPAEKLEIRMESHWAYAPESIDGIGRYVTYVGLANVSDFRKAMRSIKNDRLFAQNVRTHLRSNTNASIKSTYEKEPTKFWLYNNGIYIVCSRVTIRGGKFFKLQYPSVINGSQTLHSIDESNRSHDAKIMVRIMEMDVLNDQKLLSDVVRRTNTQNAMKLENLYAHDPYQFNIARYLDRFKIFYERRENEWKNEKRDQLQGYVPIRLKSVAQWFSTTIPQIGIGTARSNLRSLFLTHYDALFTGFDAKLNSPDYQQLATVVWTGLLLDQLKKDANKEYRSYYRISELLLVKTLHKLINDADLVHDVVDKLSRQEYGKRVIPRAVSAALRKYVKLLRVGVFKRLTREDPTRDFSNFFKVNSLTDRAYDTLIRSREYTALRREIKKELEKIK